jgi:hypothetical protein
MQFILFYAEASAKADSDKREVFVLLNLNETASYGGQSPLLRMKKPVDNRLVSFLPPFTL